MKVSNFNSILRQVNDNGEVVIDELGYRAYLLLDMTQRQLNQIAAIMIAKGYKHTDNKVYFKSGIEITIK